MYYIYGVYNIVRGVRWVKKAIKFFAVIIGIFLVMMFVMFTKMGSEMKNLQYYKVDLMEVKDGVYRGKSETTLVKVEVEVEVEVEVKSHEIIRIDLLKHDNGRGAKAEQIIDVMVEENTYDVDAISGATASSEVIKSAVSNALHSGQSNIGG